MRSMAEMVIIFGELRRKTNCVVLYKTYEKATASKATKDTTVKVTYHNRGQAEPLMRAMASRDNSDMDDSECIAVVYEVDNKSNIKVSERERADNEDSQ